MKRIEFDKTRNMFEAGGNCLGRLNELGRHELAAFAAEFYGDAKVDFSGLVDQVERQSTRLLTPCVAHRIEFVRHMNGGGLRRQFSLDSGYFAWLVR